MNLFLSRCTRGKKGAEKLEGERGKNEDFIFEKKVPASCQGEMVSL